MSETGEITLADTIAATVDRYMELLTTGTAEQIADLYAPDATVEDPIGAEIRDTREALVEFYSVITGMPERQATLAWKRIAGDTAVFEFTLITGMPEARFEITPIDIMVFGDDGRVTSMRAVWQPSDLRQLD